MAHSLPFLVVGRGYLQVFGGSESPGEDHGVGLAGVKAAQVPDVAARDPGRLAEHTT